MYNIQNIARLCTESWTFQAVVLSSSLASLQSTTLCFSLLPNCTGHQEASIGLNASIATDPVSSVGSIACNQFENHNYQIVHIKSV
jgi:hypothetical protein